MKFVCLRHPRLQMTFKTEIKREVNGEILKTPAVIIQFEDGYYETTDDKKIAYIRANVDFGVIIHEVSNAPSEKEKDIIEKSMSPRKVD